MAVSSQRTFCRRVRTLSEVNAEIAPPILFGIFGNIGLFQPVKCLRKLLHSFLGSQKYRDAPLRNVQALTDNAPRYMPLSCPCLCYV